MVAPIGGVGAFDAIGQIAGAGGSTGAAKANDGGAFGKVLNRTDSNCASEMNPP
jgi:hypothetical protein